MLHITNALLPVITTAPGVVRIAYAAYAGAVMSPAVAIEFANRLLRAAAAAQGDDMIEQARRTR